jgi:4-amino-4-deoxychorismate lyase
VSDRGRLRDDRGLHYGDGLFETIRFSDAKAPLWEWHMQRLTLGCQRLGLPEPDAGALARRARRAAASFPQSVVKLIYSAGNGPRGYARLRPPRPRTLVLVSPFVPPSTSTLRLRWCRLRLATQPALAGIKHLNRLEQVLARAEWTDTTIDEGLMLDMQEQVIAGTAGNLFVRRAGQWLTPSLHACGIAGVARRWLMTEVDAQQAPLTVAMVESADALVLTNALHGPRQALELTQQCWHVDREVQNLQQRWDALFAVGQRQ